MRRFSHQTGFTLIEIMVALVIGLILMGGVMQIFLGNRESYRVQSGMATLQENARFAMNVLREELMMAGYTAGAAVNPFVITVNGVGNASDSFTVQHDAARDCLGGIIVGVGVSQHAYSIGQAGAGVAGVAAQTSGLMCSPNGANAQLLVPGVENMQVLYGEDLGKTNGGTLELDGYPDWYVAIPTNPARIVSVRLALLVNSIEPVSRLPEAQVYQLLNAPPLGPFPDSLGRRVFTTTVVIRNKFGHT